MQETINFLFGGMDAKGSRIQSIIKTIVESGVDFVAAQEANHFEENKFKILKEFSKEIGFLHYAISLSPTFEENGAYNVATFSKSPFKEVYGFEKKMRNAALETTIDSKIGEISICNVHLTPEKEDERLVELKKILERGLGQEEI